MSSGKEEKKDRMVEAFKDLVEGIQEASGRIDEAIQRLTRLKEQCVAQGLPKTAEEVQAIIALLTGTNLK